ncbi:MAG: ubiquinol-cytochrome c reductase iron-sulfur subunit [Chloroflexota bacterium]
MSAAGNKRLSRRAFVKLATAFTGTLVSAVLGLPVIGFLLSPALRKEAGDNDPISLGPLENYSPGIPTYFSITRTKVNGWERTAKVIGMYVLRQEDGSVRVFSDICTHLGCLVTWHPDIREYVSPCHDGHFDIEGSVTKGPPPRPLDEFQTKIEDGILHVIPPAFQRRV